MTSDVLPKSNAGLDQALALVRNHFVLIIGFLILAVPTAITLGQQVWSTEAGAHAPIVLASGLWLVGQRYSQIVEAANPGPKWPWITGLAVGLPLYIFGHAYDFISLEAAALYLIGLALFCFCVGLSGMRQILFPLFYFAFLIPPPGWVITQITAPLRTFISWVSTEGLHALGFPIAREGVVLYIAQYQLLVEEACSGMNSIVGLTAVSLFYIYVMHKASLRYALFLLLFILPIAVLANIIRIVILVLLTYYYGDAVAQGFLHMTAGVVLFGVALILIFLLDHVLMLFLSRERKAEVR